MDIQNIKQQASHTLNEFQKADISSQANINLESINLASYFDHTLLKPTATSADIEKLCQEAITYKFCSVCVLPVHVKQASQILKDSSVLVCSVVGFPLGANLTISKQQECNYLLDLGAQEIDFVAPIYLAKQDSWEQVWQELVEIRKTTNKTIKIIIENCFLDDWQKAMFCLLAIEAKIDFLKTSTGFGSGGATIHDVSLMKYIAQNKAKIKASGGITNKKMAQQMIIAGANRIGASSGVAIINES